MTIYPIRADRDVAEVQDFVEELLLVTAPDVPPVHPDERREIRQNRSIPVLVLPWDDGPIAGAAKCGVTKDFGSRSVGFYLREPLETPEAVCGFRLDQVVYFHGSVKHQEELGREIWQVGMLLDRRLSHDEKSQLVPLTSWLSPLREHRDFNTDEFSFHG